MADLDHDPACLWTGMARRGVTPIPVDDCIYCPLIREVRAEEQAKQPNVEIVNAIGEPPVCRVSFDGVLRFVGTGYGGEHLADLRAKVERLPDARRVRTRSGADYGKWQGDGSVWRMDVLALIDGMAK